MVGNWITRIITQAEKIKTAIKKRASKEEIKNSKWMSPCCGSNPILKSSIFNEKEIASFKQNFCESLALSLLKSSGMKFSNSIIEAIAVLNENLDS